MSAAAAATAVRTAAENAIFPQRVLAQTGSRPRRTGTRRRARRKGSPASSSGSAVVRAGRKGRASALRPAGGREKSAGDSSMRVALPLSALLFATPEQGRENRRFDYSVAGPVDRWGNAAGIKQGNREFRFRADRQTITAPRISPDAGVVSCSDASSTAERPMLPLRAQRQISPRRRCSPVPGTTRRLP
jgi:hypothetical protein